MKVKDFIIAILITALPIFFIQLYNTYKKEEPVNPVFDNPVVLNTTYGISVDSFQLVKNKIKYNQHISIVLSQFNIIGYNNSDIVKKIMEVFDIRTFKAGNYYTAFLNNDSLKELKHLVYEHSLTEYLKISLVDSIKAELVYAKIDTIQKSTSGVIETSLWEAMLKSNTNPALALHLSDIYAWSIDFFGLQEGDYYKVIYDEIFVDSTSIGIGKIYSATFSHMQTEYNAFYFEQDGKPGYYDEQGNSLRKTFLKAPLKFSRISSGFSYSRFHPILKITRPHRGIDYAAPAGTPIQTIGDGVVIAKGYTKSAGYYIKIKHNGVYTSGYNHLSKYGKGMSVGKKVIQGQVIGYVGSTGYATGPHLDFRIWKNGQLCNPLHVKAPPVEPVKEENQARFTKIKNLMANLLKLV